MFVILLARRRRFKGNEGVVVRRIYRDAIFYFGIELCEFSSRLNWIFAMKLSDFKYTVVNILAIILWVPFPGPLREISSLWVFLLKYYVVAHVVTRLPRMMMTIVTCRVILHIRSFGVEDEVSIAPISTLRFNRAETWDEPQQGRSLRTT